MKLRKWMLRGAKWGAVSLVGLVVLLAALVQGQQWLLRWRAERLMADMHRIRLYQSTWADAQRLMRKWGRWGRYEGTCTAADCRYQITLGNSWFGVNDSVDQNWFDRLWLLLVGSGIFDTRITSLQTAFTVHSGSVWRLNHYMIVDVASGRIGSYSGEYSLIVRVHSVDTMPGNRVDLTEEIEEHPFYYVSRPGGCTNCMMADVRYSTHIPEDQLAWLTSFNFDCITRFKPCRFLGDVLPPAQSWHLYPGLEPGNPPALEMPHIPRPCSAPIWAIARDNRIAIEADVLRRESDRSDLDRPLERDTVRIVAVLKGDSHGLQGKLIDAVPFSDEQKEWNYEPSEHMKAGERYVLFFNDVSDEPSPPMIGLERCGVQPDSPEVRAEIAKGIAMNDDLRGPERW